MNARTLQRWSIVLPLAIGVAFVVLPLRGRMQAEAPRKAQAARPTEISPDVPTTISPAAITVAPPSAVPPDHVATAPAPQATAPAELAQPGSPAPNPPAPPPWAADPPPYVAAQFEKGRKAFLGKIAEDLSLSEAQQALVQVAYREREEEVARVRVEARNGTVDRDAYYRLVEAANRRFYDRLETGLSRDQILLLQRFRRQSDAAVNSLRQPPSK